jgi:hypothetical protein
VRWRETQQKKGYALVDLKLVSTSGLTTRCRVRAPTGASVGVRYPAWLMAAGMGTGRRAVNHPRVRGIVMMACDYPIKIPRKLEPKGFWRAVPEFRRGMMDAPPTLLLALDYLAHRPDVDSGSIVMVGGSFGVAAATVATALDTRIRAAALIYGGGDLSLLLVHNMDLGSALANRLGRALAWLASRPIEPTRYAGGISPRPVLVVSSPSDHLIPRASADALHATLGEPKEIRWIPLDHYAAFRERDLLAKLTGVVTEWLSREGIQQVRTDPVPTTAPRPS